MITSNKKLGNNFESAFCKILFEEGFWCHNLAQNQAGQPADVIAVRNGKAYLIDCKFCTNNKFQFSRLEENQQTAMTLWENCNNGEGWFALSLNDGRVFMLPYNLMISLSLRQSFASEQVITQMGVPLEKWLLDY